MQSRRPVFLQHAHIVRADRDRGGELEKRCARKRLHRRRDNHPRDEDDREGDERLGLIEAAHCVRVMGAGWRVTRKNTANRTGLRAFRYLSAATAVALTRFAST